MAAPPPRRRGARTSASALVTAGQTSWRYFSRYFGKSVMKLDSSTTPRGLSDCSNLSTFQWSIPSWSHGFGFLHRGAGAGGVRGAGEGEQAPGPGRRLAAAPRETGPSRVAGALYVAYMGAQWLSVQSISHVHGTPSAASGISQRAPAGVGRRAASPNWVFAARLSLEEHEKQRKCGIFGTMCILFVG